VGALLSGIVADLFGVAWAIGTVGGPTFLSGIAVAVRAAQQRQGLSGTRKVRRMDWRHGLLSAFIAGSHYSGGADGYLVFFGFRRLIQAFVGPLVHRT